MPKKNHVSVWKQQVESVSSWGVVCVLNEVESDRLWGGGTCWESDLEESTDLKQQRLGGGRERANQGNRRIGDVFPFLQ